MTKAKTALIVILIVMVLLMIAPAFAAPQKSSYRSSYSYNHSPSSGYRPRSTPRPTAAPAQRSYSQPGAGHKDITPEGPSTDGFYHPEDFYEWNLDDFSDYEEAEDYYYEHGGT